MGVATATFRYPTGSPVASGLYQWLLSSDAINASTSMAVPVLISGNLDALGNMTSTFAFNDQLITATGTTTSYQLTVRDLTGREVWNQQYFLTGTAANLNLIPPGSGVQTG
jgi:hypothetical protein